MTGVPDKLSPVVSGDWIREIPDEQWSVYSRVLSALERSGIPHAFGGAFALAHYTGRWRNTKDLDLYILPTDRERAVAAAHQAGLQDYFDSLPYDRRWIYRSHEGDIIVDFIWAMANQRASVEEHWLHGGPLLEIRGHRVRVCPIEEMIRAKLYVLQRDRCDWPDVMRLLEQREEKIGWEHLIMRLGEDRSLLAGLLAVFGWIDPAAARTIGRTVWTALGMLPPEAHEEEPSLRANLLDSRPWSKHQLRR